MTKLGLGLRENAATISALAAMLAALFSCVQTVSFNQEKLTPFRTALYTAKVDALKDYARSSSRYDAAIRRANYDVPYFENTPEGNKTRTDKDWKEIARATNFVIGEHAQLTSEISAIAGFWQDDTVKLLNQAQQASTAAGECYLLIGGKPNISMSEEWRKQLQGQTAELCDYKRISDQFTAYLAATDTALQNMKKEIRAVELGQTR